MKGAFEINMDILVMIVLAVLIFILAVFWMGILINIIVASRRILKILKRKGKRKLKRKIKHRWVVNFAIKIIALNIIGAIIISGSKNIYVWWQIYTMMEAEEKDRVAVSQEYLAALDNIPFRDEVINEEVTLWENIINEWLMYKEYFARVDECSDFAELRSCYQGNSDNIVEWPGINVDKLVKLVESVYDSVLLPATDYTFDEVEAKIGSYDEPSMVPADVYKAEFWIWISRGKGRFTAEELYQTGRAADDVLKVLKSSKKITIKEWIFFGSMAVSFYLASMEYDDGLRDLPLINYRIAEIFIYLDKYSPLKNEEEYSQHFCLMAEKALAEVGNTVEGTYGRENIKKKIPYYYCYYAEILHKFSKLCPNERENLIEMCREYASMCVMGERAGECCATCGDILEKLK